MKSPDNRFRWHHRLHSSREFQHVFDNNHLKSGSECLLVLAVSNGLEYPRLGMVIAKKKLPRAYQRNRVKRAIRESFRNNKQQLAGLDIVIVSRKGLKTVDAPGLMKDLEKHWSRLLEGQQ